MTAASLRSKEAARLAIELVLAALACWLVIQNTLLLALDPWVARPAVLVVVAAVLKAAGHVIAASWPLIVFNAVAVGAIASVLAARALARAPGGDA